MSLSEPELVLKLDLPDIFAFTDEQTKARQAQKIAHRAGPGNPNAPHAIKGSILLIETDDEVSRLVSRLLQQEGYNVSKATCLAEARTLLQANRTDLTLCRRETLPANLETEVALQEVEARTNLRIVDNFSEMLLGQVVDYESMSQSYISILDFLMSQLEGTNPVDRGHAQCVARYCRLVGQRMGMSRRELDALTAAAYLHDLESLVTNRRIGQMLQDGGTLQLPSYRPTREMLANVSFPYVVKELFEAAPSPETTGNAKPASAREALGTRILRIADVYDTLRRSKPDIPDQEGLFDWMRRQAPSAFDPEVLEVFIHIRRNERMISAMDIFLATVLLVDPQPEELNSLQLRLENEEYHVLSAKTVEEALRLLRSHNVTLVLSEQALPGNEDGFTLLRTIKNEPTLRHIPFVFHANPDTAKIKQALEMGAEDWLAKPHNVEIIAMKLNRLISLIRSGSNSPMDGVRGSVKDMGMIEMVQILSAANRSVHISVENNGITAELVVQKGKIISARTGELVGDQAAIEILLWEEGHFRILPLKNATTANVTMSTDNLVMESCFQKDTQNHHREQAAVGR